MEFVEGPFPLPNLSSFKCWSPSDLKVHNSPPEEEHNKTLLFLYFFLACAIDCNASVETEPRYINLNSGKTELDVHGYGYIEQDWMCMAMGI